MTSEREEPHVHGPNCRHDHSHEPKPVRRIQRPGRNDPCWCGSEKKYKKCHFAADEAATK
jgi:uncharacterized protein YecA (UPF0149 family)